MSDDHRQQPVAIRVTRPYASADEFLEHELETLTRTSITLVGAQSRPKGVILRFEVALTAAGGGTGSGTQLLRGEGRVVGFKENAFGDQPGLVLRFTRLDTKSKALVDRAALIREARARAALQAAMGEDSLAPPASVPPTSMAPNSIGPMSVMQEPPRVYTQEAAEAPAPPTAFGEGMFSAEDAPTAAETAANPSLFGTRGSVAPVPPASSSSSLEPISSDPAPATPSPFEDRAQTDAFVPHDDGGTRTFSPVDMTTASQRAPVLRAEAAAPPDPSREAVLERLRARARAIAQSPEKLKNLARS